MIGFEDLGGTVTDLEGAHVTVTYFSEESEHGPHASLVIDGGEKNWAEVKLNAAECRRLRNVLATAERRLA